MQHVKDRPVANLRTKTTRLSPKQLRRLADRLVAAKDPAEVARLKQALERGFYAGPVHA